MISLKHNSLRDAALYGGESILPKHRTVYWVQNRDEVNTMHEAGLPAVCITDSGPITYETGRALEQAGVEVAVFIYGEGVPDAEELTQFSMGLAQSGIAIRTAVLDCGDLCAFYGGANSDPDDLQRQINLLAPQLFTPLTIDVRPMANASASQARGMEPSVATVEKTLIWACEMPQPKEGDEEPSLWAGIFYPRSVHLLSGESGCGKSTFFYNFAVRAALGDEFLGFPFARTLRILYIDLETPAALQARKLDRITDWPPPCGLAFRRETMLPRDLAAVIAEVREHYIDIVIIDTFSQAFMTKNEDDNAEATQQMVAVRQLADEGNCSLILVHHTGKASEGIGRSVNRARGASARPAAADVVLNFESSGEDQVRLTVAKNRWGTSMKHLELRKVGEDCFEVTNAQAASEETQGLAQQAQQRAIELVGASNGEKSRGDVINELLAEGFKLKTAKRGIDNAVQCGQLVSRKSTKDGRSKVLSYPETTDTEVAAAD